MSVLADYGKEVISLLVPFITWFLNTGIKPRAKLIKATRHAFTFIVQEPICNADGEVIQPNQRVCTASVQIINSGRDTAHKVEVVFNWKPQYLNLWPVRSYEEKSDSDGRCMLIFENLAPKEEIGIEIMAVNRDLPGLIQVRSAECLAQDVQLMWFVSMPQWRIQLARVFLLLGFGAAIYWLLTLLQFLVLKTPLTS